MGGRFKYGPIAALVKAVTRGILPAYLTMAGQIKMFSHLAFKLSPDLY